MPHSELRIKILPSLRGSGASFNFVSIFAIINNDMLETLSPEREIRLLKESNESLLSAKGKLMQEIVELKKKIEDQERNKKFMAELQKQVSTLNQMLDEKSRLAKQMIANHLALEAEVNRLNSENKILTAEVERQTNISWFSKLIRRKG